MMKRSRVKRLAAMLMSMTVLTATVLSGCGKSTASDNTSYTSIGEELASLTNLSSFDLDQIVMTDSYSSNALSLEVDYLTSFDVDKLLAGFRDTADLDTNGATRYSGWENSLIGGHSVGHYMSAMAQAYNNASVSDSDKETIYSMLTELIDGLIECQENSQGEAGFIFAATVLDYDNVELQFDNVESGKTNITTQAWVPWYTMHKILAGIIEVYEETGYEPALTLATNLGDWVYNRVSQWSDQTRSVVLSIEYGGMNDALYELYAITGEEKYAVAAHQFDQDSLFEKVLAGGDNVLNDLHANTTIPKFIGALQRYITCDGETIDGETVDASIYLEYAEAFWEMVIENHTYITGANSEWEHFGKDGILDAERTNCNCETCNVYNMLKLSRMLYQITGDIKYMDYYENAYYNSILSSQNSETGMTTYFQPMATGYFKVYSTEFTNFWCCTGSGMENFTKLGDSIYFYTDNTVTVSMYFSSELTWEDGNLKLTASADNFTNDGLATYTINAIEGKEVDVDLRFRVPDWAAGDMVITLNGHEYTAQVVDGYACVTGTFNDGDVISIEIPMEIVAYALADDETSIGFKYGPVVLSADLGTESLTTTTTGVSVTIPSQKIVDSEIITLTDGTREDLMADADAFFTAGTDEDGNVVFTLNGTDLVFGAHYLKNEERYGIYWYFQTEEEQAAAAESKKRSSDEIIDTVQPGYGQYENDDLHALEESNSTGVTNDGTYRYAETGGYFTYRMAIAEDGNNYLSITLRAEDNGKTLQITSGDTVLFADTLDYIGLDDTYELRVEIPASVVATAESITANGNDYTVIPITFSGINGAESAKVCEFIYMLDVTALYTSDETIAYFVDCGDYDTTTISDGDSFGVYNSVTEQLYGYDPVTGKKWGLIDDANDQYGGSANNDGLYTAHTWCYEYNDGDGLDKTESNRYTKNQYEDGISTRYLDYAFELENGTYTVEIGFSDPWGCSNMHDVYANIGTDSEQLLASSYNVNNGVLTAEVTVTDGVLTLNFRNSTTSGLAINVSYIKISF